MTVQCLQLYHLRKEWNQTFSNITGDHDENDELIWDSKTREKVKKIAWKLFQYHQDALSQYAQAFYLINGVIKADYYRNRETIQNSPRRVEYLKKLRKTDYQDGYILQFRHYAQNWLFSNEGVCSKILIQQIKETWCKPKYSPYMPKGFTSYFFG